MDSLPTIITQLTRVKIKVIKNIANFMTTNYLVRVFVKIFLLSKFLYSGVILAQYKDATFSLEDLTLTNQNKVLSLEEFLGMIKAYHPFVKQAKIKLSSAEADLLSSRGVFDPKMIFKNTSKSFDGINYYEKLGATFKVPTYFGIDLIGSFDRNDGVNLNPEHYLSQGKLFSIGADMDLGRGFWANERLNTLKQAELFRKQTKENVRLEVNKILFEATKNYVKWYESFTAYTIWQKFVANAQFRLKAVRSAYERGDVAAIDTTEARIALNSRKLSLEQAKLDLRQSSLKVSNYLWLDQVPLELSPEITPEKDITRIQTQFIVLDKDITEHPLLNSANFGVAQGRLDQRLKSAELFPEMTLGYRWLSGDPNFEKLYFALDPQNNTIQFKVSFPLFLRKERGAFKLSQLKLQDAELNLSQKTLELRNKIQALEFTVEVTKEQSMMANKLVYDYEVLNKAEQVKFMEGESSLFLVNNRESNYIESILKQLKTNVSWLVAQADLYYNLVF